MLTATYDIQRPVDVVRDKLAYAFDQIWGLATMKNLKLELALIAIFVPVPISDAFV